MICSPIEKSFCNPRKIILHIGQDSRGHKFTHDLYFYSLTVFVVRAQNTIVRFKAKNLKSMNTTVVLHTVFKVQVKMHIWCYS